MPSASTGGRRCPPRRSCIPATSPAATRHRHRGRFPSSSWPNSKAQPTSTGSATHGSGCWWRSSSAPGCASVTPPGWRGLPGPRPAGRGLFALPQPQDAPRRGGAHRRRTRRHDQTQQERTRRGSRPPVLLPRGSANPDGRLPIPTATFHLQLGQWLQTCGVTDELGQPAHVTAHQFRHTAPLGGSTMRCRKRWSDGCSTTPATP